jgi:hypothetical protein
MLKIGAVFSALIFSTSAFAGQNLLNNSGLGITTCCSLVMVNPNPSSPIPITSYVTAGPNVAGFNTPSGNGGVAVGKMVTVLGSAYINLSFTGSVTGGNTFNAPTAIFGQQPGDVVWLTGGTNHSPKTQYRAVSSNPRTTLTINGGPQNCCLVNESGVTYEMTIVQGAYAVDPAVNGMPQAGSNGAPQFYYWPLQVTSKNSTAFNATMAGYNQSIGSSTGATLWEVTNGVQGTMQTQGPDWWNTSGCGTAVPSWYKMRGVDWDGVTPVTMPGALYSAKLVKGCTSAETFFYDLTASGPNLANTYNPAGLANFLGKTLTCGAYVKNPNANEGRIYLWDGITKTYSAYVAPGSFQWVEITAAFSPLGSRAEFGFSLDSGNVGDAFIFTQPDCEFGSSPIGAGNYKPAPFGLKMFTSHINPWAYIGRNPAFGTTMINIEQETGGILPTGLGSILTDIEANNTSTFSALYLSDSCNWPQMSALTDYNPTTQSSYGKGVQNQAVGVGRAKAQDGSGFWTDSQCLTVLDSHFAINIDLLGAVYQ